MPVMYDETDSDSDNESLYNSDHEDDELDKIYKHDYTILKYKQNKKYYIGLVGLIDNLYLFKIEKIYSFLFIRFLISSLFLYISLNFKSFN